MKLNNRFQRDNHMHRFESSHRTYNYYGNLIDICIVTVLIILAAISSIVFNLDIMASILLYLAVPALYLCFRKKKNYRKIVLASVTLGLLFGMAYDFIAEINNAYVVNYQSDILNFHIIGKTPLGDFIWAFLIPFSILVFYEHFCDDERRRQLSVHHNQAFIASILLFTSLTLYLSWFPDSGHISYAYSVVGLISIFPLLGLLFERKKLIYKLLIISIFFFGLNLIFEYTALRLGQWHFPGQYIGWINFWNVTFPIEEMIFWIIPSAPVFVYCYELFFDDHR